MSSPSSSSSSAAIVTGEEERNPLLQSSPHCGVSVAEEDESKHASQTKHSDRSKSSPAKSSQRLFSLDVFRGLTVADSSELSLIHMDELWEFTQYEMRSSLGKNFMILVDDAGGAFPSINHSPWFGVTIADFVMPFFLFGVGVSIGLVFKVVCGARGSMEPPCNAVGFIDRFLLGEKHLYQRPVYRRTKECSVNSPDYGPLPPNAPTWCVAPFDPEGVLSYMFRGIALWACDCTVQEPLTEDILVARLFVTNTAIWFSSHGASRSPSPLSGVPLSKPLYTLSYMCITAGASGMVLIIIYYVVDVIHLRKPTILFQWMGMNALIVYALAAAELLPAAIQGFYWRSPTNNLVNGTESLLQTLFHSKRWGTLALFRRKMNSENANAEATCDTCIGSHEAVTIRKSSESESTSQSHLDRAVVHRALYGSSKRRQIGSRKARDNELMRLSPSRLSRVSSTDATLD
ncbi:hypothetical protein Scep_008922 [Stephania cephalantha]|uniref:Uncharacterized protein n=1 Tax=Stephania cephalantha TaxID=152367 RepID=A0AAP0PFT6_9MAGN